MNVTGDDLDIGIVVHGTGQEIARDVANNIRAVRKELEELNKTQSASAATSQNQILSIKGITAAVVEMAAAFEAFQGFKLLIDEGLQFNRTIETARLGIASLISSQTKMTDSSGQLVENVEKLAVAQTLAQDQVTRLRVAGLQTVATTQQLVVAFQQAVGIGLRWGLTLDQIRIITIQMSQAAGALGVPLDQMNEEIRSLLTGTITPRNTRIATALGITNQQVKQAQQAGKLFDFVTTRLEAFSVAGEETAKTFSGVVSNIKEALQNLAGDATKPLFDSLKITGQAALEELFDLKNARIAEKFSGIIDIANDVFGKIGDMLASAIEAGVKGAEEFSKWLKESRVEMAGILAAASLLNTELTSILSDVFNVVLGLSDAGVKAGFFKTVLVGAALAVAEIHTAIQGLVGLFGAIGNLILNLIIGPFTKVLMPVLAAVIGVFDKDMGNAIKNAAAEGDKFLSSLGDGLRGYVDDLAESGNATDKFLERLAKLDEQAAKTANSQGALRDAIRSATREEDQALNALDEKRKQNLLNQQDYAKQATQIKLDSVRKQLAAEETYLATIDVEDKRERDRTIRNIDELKKRESALSKEVTLTPIAEPPQEKDNARARAIGETAFIKEQEKERLKDLKALLDQQKISYLDYWRAVTQVEQESIDKQIAVQKTLLDKTTDKGQKEKILDDIKVLESKRVQLVEDNNESIRKDYEKLNEEILKANVQLLKDQGKLSEARALEVGEQFRKLIRQLVAEGDVAGVAIVSALFNIDNAKTKMEEISRRAKVVQDNLSVQLQDIALQTDTHALTEKESREAIVKAYTRAKQQLELMLPDMEKAAEITKDPDQILAVENLRLKLEEMGITIRKNADDFFKLKEAGRDALTSALAGAITSASNLPFQNTQEIDNLKEHLASAQRELDRLTKEPVSEATTDRMRDLRFEIEQVNGELKNANDSIKTWEDVFVDAARSIVNALKDVAAQMLATLIIQSALKGFGFSGGGQVTKLVGGVKLQSFASGGAVSGPGTSTSDSIPAWLSAGEYVVNARSVQALGRDFLEAINSVGRVGVQPRHIPRHYADGGLVNPDPNNGGSFEATLGLEEGLVVKHLRTRNGTGALVNVVAANKRAFRGALGI